jgi:hypothetical protein
LIPGYFGGTGKESKPHLYVLLVTSTLLALPAFIKIVFDSTIRITIEQLLTGSVKNIPPVEEDADTHKCLSVGSIPIAIITRRPVLYHRIPDVDDHIFKSFTIFGIPALISMFYYLGSIEIFDSRRTHLQLTVVVYDRFKSLSPGIEYLDSLLRISFIPFHIPLQSHGVGCRTITYKLFSSIIGFIIRAVIYNLKRSRFVIERSDFR